MERDFIYIELFEIYKSMLTKKQQELFSSHFLFDLSLSEIAEQDGGSRQSVYDAIKIVKKKLIEYEKSLKIKQKKDEFNELIKRTDNKEISDKIREIIEK